MQRVLSLCFPHGCLRLWSYAITLVSWQPCLIGCARVTSPTASDWQVISPWVCTDDMSCSRTHAGLCRSHVTPLSSAREGQFSPPSRLLHVHHRGNGRGQDKRARGGDRDLSATVPRETTRPHSQPLRRRYEHATTRYSPRGRSGPVSRAPRPRPPGGQSDEQRPATRSRKAGEGPRTHRELHLRGLLKRIRSHTGAQDGLFGTILAVLCLWGAGLFLRLVIFPGVLKVGCRDKACREKR